MQLACCVACAEEVHYKYNKERKGFKMNTERLDIRIAPDLKAQLQAAAEKRMAAACQTTSKC